MGRETLNKWLSTIMLLCVILIDYACISILKTWSTLTNTNKAILVTFASIACIFTILAVSYLINTIKSIFRYK